MTKRELSIVILQALCNTTETQAIKMADTNHGEFRGCMNAPKAHLERQYELAVKILADKK